MGVSRLGVHLWTKPNQAIFRQPDLSGEIANIELLGA